MFAFHALVLFHESHTRPWHWCVIFCTSHSRRKVSWLPCSSRGTLQAAMGSLGLFGSETAPAFHLSGWYSLWKKEFAHYKRKWSWLFSWLMRARRPSLLAMLLSVVDAVAKQPVETVESQKPVPGESSHFSAQRAWGVSHECKSDAYANLSFSVPSNVWAQGKWPPQDESARRRFFLLIYPRAVSFVGRENGHARGIDAGWLLLLRRSRQQPCKKSYGLVEFSRNQQPAGTQMRHHRPVYGLWAKGRLYSVHIRCLVRHINSGLFFPIV